MLITLGGTGITRAFSPRRTTVQVAMEEASRDNGIYSDSDPGSITNASSVSGQLCSSSDEFSSNGAQVWFYDEGEFFDREELGEKLSAPKKKRKSERKSKNKKKARDILTTSTDRPKPSLPFENDAGDDAPPLDLSGTRNFKAPMVMQQNTETSSENIQVGALQPNQDAPAQASSRIAAPELPLDHPLAPNLAKPDDLNARIRENFKQDNAEEGETVRDDSKNFPAILLGKDLIQ
ncbi:hypothetical protein LTR05_001429 [Lithohypha guttulata]|uniref:Uncharacterized protein n=1 Tax=Lithohypha guttulata TaxID=1690604 RepID=A0AAN7YK71_9EURO|nr:hypothetical protein LTR05_001429 [Lithohypha guttulata]